jgi:nondiscriminating glutamyl-tRNA synthetase
MSVEEIAEEFLIEKVGKGGAVFDEEKLDWLNRMYIRRLDVRDLTERLIPFMYEIWLNPGAHGAEWLEAVGDSVQGSLTRLSDIGQEAVIFYDEHFLVSKEAASYLSTKESQQVMVALSDALLFVRSKAAEDLYSTVIDRIRKETGLKGKDLFMPIRAAVTGNLVGPELNHVFEILGRDSLLMRVERALESVKSC